MMHNPQPSRTSRARTIGASLGFLATPWAGAAVIAWQHPGSGDFQTPTNWVNGLVPGGGDQAVFDINQTNTVTYQGSVSNQRLTVRAGFVTLNLNGHTHTLTLSALPSLFVGLFTGDDAVLRVQNGTLSAVRAQLGVFTNSTGALIVSGTNALCAFSGRCVVGESGSGSLTVINGAGITCAGELVVGANQTGFGQLSIVGDNSRVICSAALSVAPLSGEGASRGGATATQGIVEILGGGRIEAPSVMIGPSGGVLGSGRLISPSVVSNGRIQPGEGVGTLRIQGNFQQTVNGVLDLEIGGLPPANGGARSDFLTVSGNATCGGRVRVTLVNGYTPQVGDTITILTAASVSGAFTGVDYAQTPPPGAGWQFAPAAGQMRLRWSGQATLGDINNDGLVNSFDLTQLLGSWGSGPSAADINGDGFVNSIDLAILLSAWTPTGN